MKNTKKIILYCWLHHYMHVGKRYMVE